jgi:uncharacterized protein (TIGR00251 family)
MDRTQTKITVRVQPGGRRNEVLGFAGEVLRVKVTARPVEGKANTAVVELLALALGVRSARISLVRGHRSRDKMLVVENLTEEEVQRLLSPEEKPTRPGTRGSRGGAP